MVNLAARLAPRLGLLLVLAVALGGFVFLFDLFTGLKSSGSNDLLEQNPSISSTVQVNSGFDLVTALTGAGHFAKPRWAGEFSRNLGKSRHLGVPARIRRRSLSCA
jgi:hypothetical protein